MKNVVSIITARMTSKRLPGKALIEINGIPAIKYMVNRLKLCNTLKNIVVATTLSEKDNELYNFCIKNRIDCFRGHETDVLDRVLNAAKEYMADIIVELTGDCPLMYHNVVDRCVESHLKQSTTKYLITSNIIERTFPRGYDVRVYDRETLQHVYDECDNDCDREHVATWMYLNEKGRKNYIRNNIFAEKHEVGNQFDITLDTQEDYELICKLVDCGKEYRLDLSPADVVNLLTTYPHLYEKVDKIERKNYFLELENEYEKIDKLKKVCTKTKKRNKK